jgi:hypothetical protein
MEKRTNSPYPRIDRPVLAIVGVLLVISTILFARNDREHEWRWYQAEFKRLVTEKYGADKAKTVPTGLQQIWIPSMAKADRCVTCHQALGWKGFETADEPFRTHPGDILKSAPPETFGCTSCHGGQGWAIDAEPAHGPVQHWAEPVLGKQLGEAYTLVDNKAALMQMNCNVCHRYERETKGADVINHAKQLVNEQGLPWMPCRQWPRRGHRPRSHLRGRQGGRAVRVRPALGAEDVLRLARCPFQGSPRPGRGDGDAQLQLQQQGRPGPGHADVVLAQVAGARGLHPGVPDTEPQTVEEREAEERV